MPELSLPDLTLHYEIEGAGPPLMLIAGMMSDSASWAPLVPLLSQKFTLIRPDNRTTGRTVPKDAPVTVDQMAADCAALIDALDLGPVHVAGHSMGGMVGLSLLNGHATVLRSLSLLASAPLRLKRNVALFQSLLAIRQSGAAEDLWLKTLFPWLFAPSVYDLPGAIEDAAAAALAYPHAQDADAMATQVAALESYEPSLIPDPLPLPVQAILAGSDMLLPCDLAIPALGSIPYQLVPAAGHSIHWDAPTDVATHLSTFIGRTPK